MKERNAAKGIWTKLAICTAGYGMMSDNVIFPLLNAIYNDFPDSSTFMQNFIVSGAGVFSIAFGLLSGLLMKKLGKKRLLVIGTIIFTVGGILGYFSKSMEFLAFTRLVDAASDGILTAVTAVMIVDIWKDEKEQCSMISNYNLASCIFGIIMSISAGYLALVNWRYAFLVNAISIISVVLCIFFVPDDDPADSESRAAKSGAPTDGNALAGPEKGRTWILVLGLLAYCIVQSANYMPSFLIDLLVAEKKLGNSVLSGYLTSILTAAGIISFLTSAKAYNHFKNPHVFIGVITAAITLELILYGESNNAFLIGLVHFMNGFFGSWLLVYFEMFIAKNAPEKSRSIWMSAATSMIYLDGLLAVYIPKIINAFAGDGTISRAATISGYGVGLIAAVYIVICIIESRRTPAAV